MSWLRSKPAVSVAVCSYESFRGCTIVRDKYGHEMFRCATVLPGGVELLAVTPTLAHGVQAVAAEAAAAPQSWKECGLRPIKRSF